MIDIWTTLDGLGCILCLLGAVIYHTKRIPGVKMFICAAVLFLLAAAKDVLKFYF